MVIAIDGPAGSGKSTTAKNVAEKLGFIHINTGAMYRGISLKCIQEDVNMEDAAQLNHLLTHTKFEFAAEGESALLMDGVDISAEITSVEVTDFVSQVSAISEVREKLVQYQRKMAEGLNVVLEGRDIGTVVFPNADHKFFLVADIHERARRRKKEMEAKGEVVSLEELTAEMLERDRKDSTRKHSPLKKAEDAVEIDTTGISIEEQVNRIVEIVNKTIK
ncbi:MAG TPA: (d)CMP kinase [Candidatus Marinimicrobia bacterium]|mgnify:FL=1|nr:(d)CMP kinase [Candidatus Neomarinimicrobiota bacterium]